MLGGPAAGNARGGNNYQFGFIRKQLEGPAPRGWVACSQGSQPHSCSKILAKQLKWGQSCGGSRHLYPLSLNREKDPPSPHSSLSLPPLFSCTLLSHPATCSGHVTLSAHVRRRAQESMGFSTRLRGLDSNLSLSIAFGQLFNHLILHTHYKKG